MFYVVLMLRNIWLRIFYNTVVCIVWGLEKGQVETSRTLLLEKTAQGVGESCIPEYVMLL